jgi:hypothetical protein
MSANGIRRRLARTEARGADVHRIGTAVDGGDAGFQILGGRKQLGHDGHDLLRDTIKVQVFVARTSNFG